jgi:predicted O-methyltransferase YrrM
MADSDVQITDPRVEGYILEVAQLGGAHGLPDSLPAVLKEIEELSDRARFPIVGPLLGRTLYLLAGLSGARRIFDAGTGIGYSASWLAAGAGPGATVVCVDAAEGNLARARDFHERAGLGVDFEYRAGDASEVLEADPGPFDVIFNDLDKGAYPRFAKLAVARLRPGGVYAADNVLWYGKVVLARPTRDAWTAAVDQHNQWVFSNPTLFATIHDQRDGLLVAVRRRA